MKSEAFLPKGADRAATITFLVDGTRWTGFNRNRIAPESASRSWRALCSERLASTP